MPLAPAAFAEEWPRAPRQGVPRSSHGPGPRVQAWRRPASRITTLLPSRTGCRMLLGPVSLSQQPLPLACAAYWRTSAAAQPAGTSANGFTHDAAAHPTVDDSHLPSSEADRVPRERQASSAPAKRGTVREAGGGGRSRRASPTPGHRAPAKHASQVTAYISRCDSLQALHRSVLPGGRGCWGLPDTRMLDRSSRSVRLLFHGFDLPATGSS